jgi:hypothetical protein
METTQGCLHGTDREDAPTALQVISEMIEAGKEILWTFDPEHDLADDYAVKIYQAMEMARRRGCPGVKNTTSND